MEDYDADDRAGRPARGTGCVLEDGVCHMSGAGPAGDSGFGEGYYSVRGSGLPHIDVVGYRGEVDWSQLVRQLAQVTESGGPRIGSANN
jgi:hypothetical protein